MNELHVWLDDAGLGPATRIGTLRRHESRSGDTVSFEYDSTWLGNCSQPLPFQLDPDLPLSIGRHYSRSGADRLAGIFKDCSPDRWGRTLMDRREAIQAREAGRKVRSLRAWDYLIGVNDESRMGALRLLDPEQVRYVDDQELSAPPMTELRQLEHIAVRIERDEPIESAEAINWFRQLVAPGASLGGARPKANFRGLDTSMWLAKFPSSEDRFDIGLWEFLAHRLAIHAGIDVPEAQRMRLSARGTTFAARRFDRAGEQRTLFASAMTLLGAEESEGHSYLDIVNVIENQGNTGRIAEDLEQLYRRVLFNILIGNRDDHLRNHGFLRARNGWCLSPAFDINPNADKHTHVLAINENDPTPDTRLLEDTADYYRLTRKRVATVTSAVRGAVQDWEAIARSLGIPSSQIATLTAIIDPDR